MFLRGEEQRPHQLDSCISARFHGRLRRHSRDGCGDYVAFEQLCEVRFMSPLRLRYLLL